MLNKHLIAPTRPVADPGNIVCWRNFRITLLTPALFRIEEDAQQLFCDEATQAIWFRDMPPVIHTVQQEENACVIRTEATALHLAEDLNESFVVLSDGRKAWLNNDGTLPGTCRTLDCCDGEISYEPMGDIPKGQPIDMAAGVVSRTGAAVYDDSPSLLLLQDGTVHPREHDERDLYVFAFGDDYRGAVRALYSICGMPPALPRYALGNWWSRYWAYTQQEYLDLMDSFAERGIPFTVATVDMDWHPSKDLPGGADGWTGYTWNRELFPDYRAFLQLLHQKGLHVTLNLHPALGVRTFETQYPAMAARMGVDPASRETIPFDMTDPTFISAYLDVLHHPYEQEGVDFWWIDWQQGIQSAVLGLDPLWSLNHYHTLDICRKEPGIILSRYAGMGSHRYPIGFSGDTYITWNTLRFLPRFTAEASNAGYTWWSHDIGGHMGGVKDNELFVRFVQFGVFSPINRLHSTAANTLSKDISAYCGGAGLIVREFLRLRHAMIPFLYTASCQTAEQGLALVEPMYYEHPQEADSYACEGQYLFGRQMIAAPVTEKSSESGLAATRVWLPEGIWTDFFTGDVYCGSGWREMIRPLDSFPLLAKEGGFFVLDGTQEAGNSTALPAALDVHIFAGSGSYDLIEDEKGSRAITHFASRQISPLQQIVTIAAEDPGYILPVRSMTLRFRSVLNGQVCAMAGGVSCPVYQRQEGEYTLVRLSGIKSSDCCEIVITENAAPAQRRNAALLRAVTSMEGDADMKERLYAQLKNAASTHEALIRLKDFPLSRMQQAQLKEIIEQ